MTSPICPLELETDETYIDKTDGEIFTVAAVEVVGVSAKITTTDGKTFTIGGLYGGLRRFEAAALTLDALLLLLEEGDPRGLLDPADAVEVLTEARADARPAHKTAVAMAPRPVVLGWALAVMPEAYGRFLTYGTRVSKIDHALAGLRSSVR